jgi:hypothetical protein
MSETKTILPRILLEMSAQGATVFRQNVGTGWVGTGAPVRISRPTQVTLHPGDVVLRGPVRPLHAGLVKGSSDVIGWDSVTIMPEMIGTKIAQFVAVEAKLPGGKPSAQQENFLEVVRAAGGKAGVATSAEDAREILGRPNKPLKPSP